MAFTEKHVSALAAGGGTGLSEVSPFTLSEMIAEINAAGAGGSAGWRYNVKADGVYNRSATDTLTGTGNMTSPLVIRGYKNVIGDGYLGRTFGNTGLLIPTNMPSIVYATGFKFTTPGAAACLITESLNISGAIVSNSLFGLSTWTQGLCRHCIITNSPTSGSTSTGAVGANAGVTFLNCDVYLAGSGYSTAASAFQISNDTVTILNSRIRCNVGQGVTSSGAARIIGCIVYRCGQTGIQVSAGTTVELNTVVNCGTVGVRIASGTGPPTQVRNNLITDNAGLGIEAIASRGFICEFNRLDRNVGGAMSTGNDWLDATNYGGNTTSVLQAAEYEDAANDDYRLKGTSPAIGAGHFPYADIGALQRQNRQRSVVI